MQWYDPMLVFLALIGLVTIFVSSFHGKKWVWGLLCILVAAVIKAAIWFESLV